MLPCSALHPQEYVAGAPAVPDAARALGAPVAHAMPVRDDARTARELALQARPQPEIHLRRKKERDDARAGELGAEEVFLPEGDAFGDAGRRRVGARLADALRIDVYADAARAVAARRLDDDAPVAAAQVVDHVL